MSVVSLKTFQPSTVAGHLRIGVEMLSARTSAIHPDLLLLTVFFRRRAIGGSSNVKSERHLRGGAKTTPSCNCGPPNERRTAKNPGKPFT